MRHWIKLILLVAVTTACGQGGSGSVDGPALVPTPEEEGPGYRIIDLMREYSPSNASNVEVHVPAWVTSVSLPSEVSDLSGNSGIGWLSVKTPYEVYCYQGNASNMSTNNGTKYVLKKKTKGGSCNGSGTNISGSQDLFGLSNKKVKFKIESGACSGSACINTYIVFDFYLN